MLKLLPPVEPDPAEKVRKRVRRYVRPDGMLQCERCAGRVVMTATAGVRIVGGRKTEGTVVEKDVCADCYRQGIFSPMMPELIPIK